MTDPVKPYRVDERDGRHVVVDADDRTVCACSGEVDAAHYAELLNRAFRAGYKRGYRAGKTAG